MDSRRLALELASRMRDIVPEGVTVTVEGDLLRFGNRGTARAGSYGCQWINGGQGSIEDLTVRASELALNDLQDFVTEATTEPWPGSGSPPCPGARLEGRLIELWFADHDHPDAQLRPLPLDD